MSIIKDNTKGVLEEADKRIKKALRKAALMVERSAKKEAPVLTGTLKRSIISNWYGASAARQIAWSDELKVVKDKKTGQPRTVRVKAGKSRIEPPKSRMAIVGTNVEYAPYVEMGTRFWPGKPYLRPALEMNKDKIKQLFKEK